MKLLVYLLLSCSSYCNLSTKLFLCVLKVVRSKLKRIFNIASKVILGHEEIASDVDFICLLYSIE